MINVWVDNGEMMMIKKSMIGIQIINIKIVLQMMILMFPLMMLFLQAQDAKLVMVNFNAQNALMDFI